MKIAQNEIFAVDRLPERDAIVVAYSAEARARIQRQIVDQRGSEVAGRTKVVVIRDRLAAEEKLTGIRKPVLLDEAFQISAPTATLDRVLELARGANVAFGKR
ncbi:hypothetical protein [Bradyrhizobium cenepequi]